MSEEISLVQVHLGKSLPPHLYSQLEQSRLLNPDLPIFLLINREAEGDRDRLRASGVTLVTREALATSRQHRRFLRRNRLDKRRLGGFWLYTSERFFAIESFLEACGLRNVVHLENDVMLYARLRELRSAFESTVPHIGLTMDSDERCVPGFMFMRDLDSLSAMNEFIVEKTLRRAKSDMSSLGLFMAESASGSCTALPVLPPSYRGLHALESREGGRGEAPWFDEHFDSFGGVFDAAALGQYLGGIDKQHNPGDTRGFVSEAAVYDPRKFGLHWKLEDGLSLPYGQFGDHEFPVYNLHIHSKQLEEFSSLRTER